MTEPLMSAGAGEGGRKVSAYDQQVLRAVGDGAGTWMVAARMHVPTADIRQRLKRLEREGLVHRSPRSSINNIIWIVERKPQ